jgi:hypothetical protein
MKNNYTRRALAASMPAELPREVIETTGRPVRVEHGTYFLKCGSRTQKAVMVR